MAEHRRRLKTLVGAGSAIYASNDTQATFGIDRAIALAKIAEREKITRLFTADLLQSDPAGQRPAARTAQAGIAG